MTALTYDLVIVGAGTGNALPTDEFTGWRIALVETDRFGATCLKRGCIPSKMLVHTADVARTAQDAERFGLNVRWEGADWAAIRHRGSLGTEVTIVGRAEVVEQALLEL